MTQEEKARAYDKALEGFEDYIKSLKNVNDGIWSARDIENSLSEIFPELKDKESEDERMWKLIKKYAHSNISDMALNADHITRNHLESWLEKQSEQKPADKVEPKFHEGDWTISNLDRKARQISEVHFDEYNGYYVVNGKSVNLEEYDRLHRLWTIKDAKDGDVLSNGKMIVIFKHFEEPSYRQRIVAYIGLDRGGDIQITNDTWSLGIDKAEPATKEQRDKLEKAMAEAGYKFDVNKKELKKIEQKTAWGAEDEKSAESLHGWLDTLVNYIHHDTIVSLDLRRERMQQVEQLKTWLKSLKERCTWKPTDEQIIALRWVLNNIPYNKHKEEISGLLDQIKEL